MIQALFRVHPHEVKCDLLGIIRVDIAHLRQLSPTGRDYPWQVPQPLDGMVRKLQVFGESAKIAIDADGIITYRRGGGGDSRSWDGVFSQLAGSAGSR